MIVVAPGKQPELRFAIPGDPDCAACLNCIEDTATVTLQNVWERRKVRELARV